MSKLRAQSPPTTERKHIPAEQVFLASGGCQFITLVRDWPRARKYEGECEAAVVGCF